MDRREDSNKVIFKGSDRTFCKIRTVITRRLELRSKMIFFKQLEELTGDFIISSNGVKGKIGKREVIEGVRVSFEVRRGRSRGHGFNMDITMEDGD